jgi:hypothetical protein
MKWAFFVLAVTAVAILAHRSEAGEAVICVGMEDEYALLMDEGAECFEWETELRVSGGGIQPGGDAEALAVFGEKEDCPEGSEGKEAKVGIDNDGDGDLDAGEVLTVTGMCSSAE